MLINAQEFSEYQSEQGVYFSAPAYDAERMFFAYQKDLCELRVILQNGHERATIGPSMPRGNFVPVVQEHPIKEIFRKAGIELVALPSHDKRLHRAQRFPTNENPNAQFDPDVLINPSNVDSVYAPYTFKEKGLVYKTLSRILPKFGQKAWIEFNDNRHTRILVDTSPAEARARLMKARSNITNYKLYSHGQ